MSEKDEEDTGNHKITSLNYIVKGKEKCRLGSLTVHYDGVLSSIPSVRR